MTNEQIAEIIGEKPMTGDGYWPDYSTADAALRVLKWMNMQCMQTFMLGVDDFSEKWCVYISDDDGCNQGEECDTACLAILAAFEWFCKEGK